jgi:hypothetical protein
MTLAKFKAKFGNKNGQGALELPVSFLQEGKSVIAYTPALDISTSGKNMTQAKKRFEELVKMFVDDLVERGTLDVVLLGLGWEKVERNQDGTRWLPPQKILSQEEIRVPVRA